MSSDRARLPRPAGQRRAGPATKAVIASPACGGRCAQRDDADRRQRRAGQHVGEVDQRRVQTMPSDSARASATPCHSGVSQRDPLDRAGSWLDREERAGEQEQRRDDEPEDRGERRRSSLRRREGAIGAAKASPVSTAAGIASTCPSGSTAPKSDDHEQEDAAPRSQPERRSRARWPRRRATGPAASRPSRRSVRTHLKPAHDRPGRLARRRLHRRRRRGAPGPRNTRYGHAADRCRLAWSTTLPRPTPIAARYSTGGRNVPKSAPRQVRR